MSVRSFLQTVRWFSGILLLPVGSLAADPATAIQLPYSKRTASYSGYHAGTRGDIRTVGMAGATIGLGDTFAAAGDNPAGLALTMSIGDTHASANQISDRELQLSGSPVPSTSAGAALQPSHWALSLGAINTWGEGQYFEIPGQPAPLHLEQFIREYRFGVARRFKNRGLALGVQLRLGALRQSLGAEPNEFANPAQTSHALGATLGLMYRLPWGFIGGAALNTPMRYTPDTPGTQFAALPGFLQPVQTPLRASLGLGYIPNRIFRADFTLHLVDSTPGASLLADQSRPAGTQGTIEPRLGTAYVFGDFRRVRATGFAGSYLEPARIQGTTPRLHGTGGIELKWTFVNFGLGFDSAPRYRNFMASLGIDPFGVMERMGLIPSGPPSRPKRLLPSPLYRSNEGLPPGLRDEEKPPARGGAGTAIDPLQVGFDIPRKLGEKLDKLDVDGVYDSLKEIPAGIGRDLEEIRDALKKSPGQ